MYRCSQLWVIQPKSLRSGGLGPLLTASRNLGITVRVLDTNKPVQPPKDAKAKTKHVAKFSNERSYLDEILIKHEEEPKTTAQKVKKKAENTFFYLVFAGSVVALGALAYYFIEQFISIDSPQTIYSRTLKMVQNDDRVLDIFGGSLKGYGEDTGRGRRRHIANQRYVTKEGEERVRVMYHVKGNHRTGKVYAEVAKKDGNWDYRMVYVLTDDTVPRNIILIDNREKDPNALV
uniref:Mitochondrial import inner membrane translocase subunit Tim21 n=1 Tax=Panagrellus redivivus TaxID=6233 RepID=A0A7E4V2P8_PANRE